MADETAVKEALQVVLTSAQDEHEYLERTAVAICQELEGEGGSSGSSVASRLRSLSGRVTERLKDDFRLGVQKTLGAASMHYVMDLERVAMGYVVAPGVEGDDAVAAIEQADTTVEGPASTLSELLEGDLLPDTEDNTAEGAREEEGGL